MERYSSGLVERSSQMYEELLEKEIIPEIERESLDELSTAELSKVVEKLDETIQTYTEKINASEDVEERKQMRSLRKLENRRNLRQPKN